MCGFAELLSMTNSEMCPGTTNAPGPHVTRGRPYPARAGDVGRAVSAQTACAPSSPVRIRTSRSTGETHTLPSPILPVAADETMVSTT